MNDSKKLWLSVDNKFSDNKVTLGKYTSDDIINNPRQVCFVSARYKFVSKMFENLNEVIEVGCGDGYGSPFVAQTVKNLISTDINHDLILDSKKRYQFLNNVDFQYFDFREKPYPKKVSGIYLVDVIEHIFPEEENNFIKNLTESLTSNGVLLIGTPNKTAEEYASVWSKEAHINLKDHLSLKELCHRFFYNVFLFGMNDEVLHTGFNPMCHYLWALCVDLKYSYNFDKKD
jgi:2-polyprenyl-3-methyl-5-hydroxy-6-metoxy-1,4-benzoquinol methylase